MQKFEQLQKILFSKVPVRAVLAISLVFSVLAIAFILLFRIVPEQNEKYIMLVIGYMLAKMGTVYDWNFGGSKTESDTKKIDAINNVNP